jgi:hypothetical protein
VSGSEEGSVHGGRAAAIGSGVTRGGSFHWPPLGRRGAHDECDDDDLDEPLLGGGDNDDEHDDEIDGARLEGGGGSESSELLVGLVQV